MGAHEESGPFWPKLEGHLTVSPCLRYYLMLEEVMIELDRHEEALADQVRDVMEPLWYRLSDEEHEWVNHRDINWNEPVGSIPG